MQVVLCTCHFFPLLVALVLVAAALCALDENDPLATPPSPRLASDDWMREAASDVMGLDEGMIDWTVCCVMQQRISSG